jgi:hypothetical protein
VKDLDELRAIMPLPRMLEALGLEESARKSARSPLRHDKKPSFSVFEFRGRHFWKDHGNTDKGDELDFLQQHYGMDFKQALAKWSEMCGKTMDEEKFVKRQEDFGSCFGLEPEGHVKLVGVLAEWRGYNESTCRWLIGHRHVGLYQGQVCFPILSALNVLKGVHICNPNKHPKFRILGGRQLPWFIGKPDTSVVHVFESQFDAFSLLELVGQDTSVLITRGASNTSKARGYLETLLGKSSKEVAIYLWPQNDVTDDGGMTPAQKWCDGLVDEFQVVHIVDTPHEFEDLNDWLRKGAVVGDVAGCIAGAKKLGDNLKASLPAIMNSQAFTSLEMVPPTQVIKGILHKGCKMVVGGGSKGRKTWSLIHLALAVATGKPWWGFGTTKGKVLYINFELTDFVAHDRISRITEAMEVNDITGLDVWNLRGYACDIELLGPQITDAVVDRQYDLLIVDPVYKLLGDKDENAAGEIGRIMNELEQICKLSGAALAFGHHYAKGDAFAKTSIDRMSGSGVFARDPDCIISLDVHSEPEHFIVEPTLRAFAPVEPFVVRWDFPLMRKVEGLQIEFKGQKKEALGGYTEKDMLLMLPRDGYTDTEWREAALENHGTTKSTYYKFRKALTEQDKIFRNSEQKYIKL